MNITEVRVKLCGEKSERVRAFCSVTLDGDFVIRDVKVIDGVNGLFVAMPSRKLSDHCPKCRGKNHLRARYCNNCGAKLGDGRGPRDGQGRSKLHADIAHPINQAGREQIQAAVVEAFQREVEQSGEPDYVPQRFDDEEDIESTEYEDLVAELRQSAAQRAAGRREDPATPPPREPRREPSESRTEAPTPPLRTEPPAPPPRPVRVEPPAPPPRPVERAAPPPPAPVQPARPVQRESAAAEDDSFGAGIL